MFSPATALILQQSGVFGLQPCIGFLVLSALLPQSPVFCGKHFTLVYHVCVLVFFALDVDYVVEVLVRVRHDKGHLGVVLQLGPGSLTLVKAAEAPAWHRGHGSCFFLGRRSGHHDEGILRAERLWSQ